MFNALLGGFVAWSLLAGALPAPWPAAAAFALGGALLLNGHAHGATLTVDVLARRSRFFAVNPGLKLWGCMALLALCLLARTPWPPLALFLTASVLTVAGGVRPRAYLSLLGAPATAMCNAAMLSSGNDLQLFFTDNIEEKTLPREVLRFLVEQGISVTVESNREQEDT